ncbi:MAG: DUF2939 domain-containing protein, partial [Pseudolabrys sp.]
SHIMYSSMRWTLVIIFALIILLAGYTVWPFYGLYRIASAVETRNSAALQDLVDFPSLRASMAQQIANAHLKITGKSAESSDGSRSLGSRFGAMIADALLAKIIFNPERLLDLLGKGSVSANPSPPSGLAAPFAANSLGSAWQTWLNSDYSGANFYVAVPVDRPFDQRFGVRLRWVDWDWKLSGLDLPESMALDLAQELARTR